MNITAEIIEAFAGMFLSPRYDNPVATPDFHRDCWRLYCSPARQAMVIAPRNHAKSTALSFDYILAEVMFRSSDYVIFIGSTEGNAAEFVSNIYEELHGNEALIAEFGPFSFETDSKTDCIVRFPDGHRFRIIARGAEQKIRGKMWNGKRPNLLVCDDMEDDEAVMSRARREKFSQWFFRAAKPALSHGGKIRVHGTVLHEDSLLARLKKNSQWVHLFYRAHASFDDFSDILWPEHWNEAKLRSIRQEFIDNQDAPGYSQEYLNNPLDNSEAYLRRQDFIPMESEDHIKPKVFGVGVDWAISKSDKANRTSMTIGGKCVANLLHIVDQRVGRWDTEEIIEELFLIQKRWNPDFFWVENGVIWKTMSPIIYREMLSRDCMLNIIPLMPVKDKATRGRSLQKRMRAGGCRFDIAPEWFPGYQDELLRFTGYNEASLDDQFDSTAWLSIGFEHHADLDEKDFYTEEEEEFERSNPRQVQGRNPVTGY